MSDEELKAIRSSILERVELVCNEYHDHSALGGCLDGDPKDITILKLIEVIAKERRIARDAIARWETGPWAS